MAGYVKETVGQQWSKRARERWLRKNRSYLADQPVRLIIDKRHKWNVGLVASVKMGGMVPWESRYERDKLLKLECDNTVAAFYAQPETIEYKIFGKTHRYTPDIRVELADGSVEIVEVKPQRFADHPSNVIAFEAIEKVYEARGISFRVETEKHIYEKQNMTRIRENLRWRAFIPPYALAAHVSEIFSTGTPPSVLGDLEAMLDFNPEDRRKLISMAIRGYFTLPMDQKITEKSPVEPSPINPFLPHSVRRRVLKGKRPR